ncbi:MAG TPA: hypothetical protein VFC90_13845, partial [Planctomycetota bacterium]|nr:hypothetical protein [Planctomycetota bacterium]
FMDPEEKRSTWAIVRAGGGTVSLALTTERDGDFEVFMNSEDCKTLVKHLGEAIVATAYPPR